MRIPNDIRAIALCAMVAMATTAHATGDPEGATPSYRVSELDGGRRLVEWTSPTKWDDVADDTSDVEVLSVPDAKGAYTNALLLGPRVDLDGVLDEIGETEEKRESETPTGPVIRFDGKGGFVYDRGPIEYRGQTKERGDGEPNEEDNGNEERKDLAPPQKPPKLFGEEIDEEETLEVAYEFFAGDTKPAKAKSRVKRARKFYVKAFQWWEQQINDTCEFDVAFQDLGDDFETLTHVVPLKGKKLQQAKRQKKPLTKKVGYRNYTTEEQWAKAPKETWLIGAEKRDALLRSPNPGQRFHLAIFHVKGIAFRDEGRKRNVEHVLFKPGIGILRRPVQDKQNTAIHESGHFLGLRDGDGAIMTYAPAGKRRGGSLYGERKFLKEWCGKIEANIRGPA